MSYNHEKKSRMTAQELDYRTKKMHKDTHHSGFSDTTFIFPFKNVLKMRSHVVMFLRVSHCFSVSLQKMRCC